MTTSAAGGSSWQEVVGARLAHLMLPLLGLKMSVDVLAWCSILPGVTVRIAMIILFMIMVGVGAHLINGKGLCVRCMMEVPDDAPVRAVRQRRRLWVFHRFTSKSGIVVLIAAMIIETSIGKMLYDGPSIRDGTAGSWLFSPSDLWIDLGAYSFWLHHKLRPWCPYCKRWGDGGVHEQVPNPDPSIQKVS